MAPRLTRQESDYHTLATQRAKEWVGPTLPATTHDKTIWECAEGHIWQATYASLEHADSGCPHCARVVALTPDQFRKIAADRGIEWLGGVVSSREKTRWRCPKGHEWEAQYGNIRNGKGCPECWDVRR